MSQFEDLLWCHLVDEHGAERAVAGTDIRRTSRPFVLGVSVSGLAAVTATAALTLGASTSTSRASAFTESPDGTVTVTIHEVETSASALNAAFARHGINEVDVPMEPDCTASPPFGWDGPLSSAYHDGNLPPFTFSANPPAAPTGITGFIAAKVVGDTLLTASGYMKTGTIPSCFPEAVLHHVPGSDSPSDSATGPTPPPTPAGTP